MNLLIYSVLCHVSCCVILVCFVFRGLLCADLPLFVMFVLCLSCVELCCDTCCVFLCDVVCCVMFMCVEM